MPFLAAITVLIETYWNVKSGKYTNAYFVGHVLIETYWNVKFDADALLEIEEQVLIETYWNVKVYGTHDIIFSFSY